jgi:hypothetical protein
MNSVVCSIKKEVMFFQALKIIILNYRKKTRVFQILRLQSLD